MNETDGSFSQTQEKFQAKRNHPSYQKAQIGRFDSVNRYGEFHPQPSYLGGTSMGQDWSEDLRSDSAWEVDHSGKGPRGYVRSERIILDDICEDLFFHPEIDASDIEVRIEDSFVILEGEVKSLREKYLAEDISFSIPGVSQVKNRIKLKKDRRWLFK